MNKHCIEGREPLNNLKHVLKIMRITLSFLFFCILFSSASNSYSQEFTIKSKTASIKEVCKEIEKESDYVFIFSDNCEKLIDKQVNVEANSKDVTEVLNAVLSSTGLTYKILDKQIVVYKSTESAPSVAVEQPDINIIQQPAKKQITGKVVDAQGDAIIGANIIETGTTNGTVTDIDGKFSLSVGDNATIRISYIGYLEQTIATVGQSTFNITLLEDAKSLNEVIVVGYGVQKKINLTGSVASVNEDEISNRPVARASEVLQGLVPGLTIAYPRGGDPDAKLNWQIRGQGSPYILVDGIPMDVNSVNPNDIESVTVLKDASSAAIYGGSAAYGVVLITTKSGKLDTGTSITYSNNIAFSKPTTLPKMMNSLEYANWWNTITENSGAAPMFSPVVIERIKAYLEDPENAPSTYPDSSNPTRWGRMDQANANTDWYQVYFKDWAVHQQHNISLRGGTTKSGYFLSAGLYDNKGQMAYGDDSYKRFTVSGSFNYDIKDWFRIGFKPKFSRAITDWPHDGYGGDGLGRQVLFHDLARRWITDPVTTPDGQWGEMSRIAIYESGARDKNADENLYLTYEAEIKPMKNWNIIGSYTYGKRSFDRLNHQPVVYLNDLNGVPFIIYDLVPPNQVHKEFRSDNFQKIDLYSTYESQIENHNFKVMVGHNRQSGRNNYLYSKKQNLVTDEVPSLSTATGRIVSNDEITQFATMGYFGRINYNFSEKYLVELNARYDGSYKYKKEDRWGFFPSISAGYRISEESFFEPLKNFIPLLTVRASYGELGDQAGAAYSYLSIMNVTPEIGYIIGDSRPSTVSIPNILSDNLTWETLTTKNIGIDAVLFQNRLFTYFDLYERKRSDIISSGMPLPSLLGTSAPSINYDIHKTKGWELTINWIERVNSDFNYSIGLNISDYVTKVVKTNNPNGLLSLNYVGKTLGEIWGYKTEGLFQSEQEIASAPNQNEIFGTWYPGDVRYSNLDNDDKISAGNNTLQNPGDRTIIGNSLPRYLYNIKTEVNWKNINFSMLWSGIGKQDRWFSNYTFWGVGSLWHHSAFKEHLDYWSPENPDAYFPRPAYQPNKNRQVSDRYLQKTNFIRLKNIQLGYSLDKDLLKSLKVFSDVTIYLSGENMVTFSNLFDYFDPEALSGQFGEGKVHPLPKQISVGLNVTL
jgi:TonB-linked SusC/RagA family outer membrane protein